MRAETVRSKSNTSGTIVQTFNLVGHAVGDVVLCKLDRNAFRTGQVHISRPAIGKAPCTASATSRHDSRQAASTERSRDIY